MDEEVAFEVEFLGKVSKFWRGMWNGRWEERGRYTLRI
jgi:hypothetical protein